MFNRLLTTANQWHSKPLTLKWISRNCGRFDCVRFRIDSQTLVRNVSKLSHIGALPSVKLRQFHIEIEAKWNKLFVWSSMAVVRSLHVNSCQNDTYKFCGYGTFAKSVNFGKFYIEVDGEEHEDIGKGRPSNNVAKQSADARKNWRFYDLLLWINCQNSEIYQIWHRNIWPKILTDARKLVEI